MSQGHEIKSTCLQQGNEMNNFCLQTESGFEGLGGTPLPKLSFKCPPSRGFCNPLSASLWNSQASYPGGGNPHMKGVGMLVGNFELNP